MSSQEVPAGTPTLPFLHLFSRANKRNITHHLQDRLVGGRLPGRSGVQTLHTYMLPPCRKCKLLTSGPWLEVAPVGLADVSIMPESPGAQGDGQPLALWAVSDKGDVLCRLGVTELNPAVSARQTL